MTDDALLTTRERSEAGWLAWGPYSFEKVLRAQHQKSWKLSRLATMREIAEWLNEHPMATSQSLRCRLEAKIQEEARK